MTRKTALDKAALEELITIGNSAERTCWYTREEYRDLMHVLQHLEMHLLIQYEDAIGDGERAAYAYKLTRKGQGAYRAAFDAFIDKRKT